MASPARLDLVHKAVCSGVFGHIQWKNSAARLMRDDPRMTGLTPEGIRHLLRQFVQGGNALTVREETRTEYLEEDSDNPYWYRALFPVPGLAHGLFVEVKLVEDDEKEPWVEIVSVHPHLS